MASLITFGGAPATVGFRVPATLRNTQLSRARTALRGSSTDNGETTPILSATDTRAAGIAACAAAFAAFGCHRRTTAAAASQAAALGTVPMAGVTVPHSAKQQQQQQQKSLRGARMIVCAGSELPEGRKLRVAVVGGGPGGASCADALARAGIETYLIERKLDNCKPCGGAIPLCMLEEFDLPTDIVDRKVRKMTMISPTNKEVQIGSTLKDDEFIGMVRREVLDDFLRRRAKENGATVINGLFMGMTMPQSKTEPYVLTYNNLDKDAKGEKRTLEVDVVIGGDGANSRVAKAIEAGDYEYAIAFQERMRIPEDKMEYYKERAEMYVGEDVSPDFYAWVFPKCDHVAVGTGTVIDKKGIQKYQQGIRDRAKTRIEGGEILRVEAHPIPEHPRPRRVNGRAALIGDAAGYVTKCSGEGIYFAAKSGRMCAEVIAQRSKGGTRMLEDYDLYEYCRQFDDKYGATYLVLDQLQKVFYTSDAARESFVELCEEEYVQKVTFDSYLYKTVQGNDPIGDMKLGIKTFQSLWKNNFSKPEPMRELA
jgi:geranylgeranyl reductase